MEAPKQYDETQRVVSPFANSEAVMPTKKNNTGKIVLWVLAAIILVAAGAFGGVFLTHYLNDPLRTLEGFPVAKYLDSYRGLAGSKFKG